MFIADVSRIELRYRDLLALPASSLLIMLVTWGLSLLLGRALHLSRAEQGTATISSMSINNGFLFPFVLAVWGAAGFGQLALFDLGHVIGQSFLVYAIATTYGGQCRGVQPPSCAACWVFPAVGAAGGAADQCFRCQRCRTG